MTYLKIGINLERTMVCEESDWVSDISAPRSIRRWRQHYMNTSSVPIVKATRSPMWCGMIHRRHDFGQKWEQVVTRQIAALGKWLGLSRELQSQDDKDSK